MLGASVFSTLNEKVEYAKKILKGELRPLSCRLQSERSTPEILLRKMQVGRMAVAEVKRDIFGYPIVKTARNKKLRLVPLDR